eukprot:CAMPEP_0184475642 /NCGR_PEP_ID=MMETSP0740-20130409/146664_1 /TAXON_ID=385413 /ORGANISM="Thalassiosira miniscula, Strain CCMP1093" /LENGTH=68 /DNA_ID=CAMNT_0026853161 /DNA_START=1323 /DNA_END=1526 /DNA_ORIENTATION=+
MKGEKDDQDNKGSGSDSVEPLDDYVELVLATKENTKNVGWLITDNESSIGKECSIPFYETVKEGKECL